MITGGQSYVSSPPSFSTDGKRLLVCTANTISIFSTTTGLLMNELEGHTHRVTSVVVVPAEPKFMCFCWTASLDGTIRYWDFASGEMIRKVEVKLPIFSMAIPITSCSSENIDKKSRIYAFISVDVTSKPTDNHKALHGRIQICDLFTSRRVGGFLTETRKPEVITISPSGEYLGIPNRRKIHIWKIPTGKFNFNEIKVIKLHHTKNFTTIAFHPTERIVAGGDITGRILVWRGFGSRSCFGREEIDDDGDDADSSPTTWHWHADEVKFLYFSFDGAYLYSGGKEGVIVVWQLETGKKKFKPRLGSPLLYFAQSSDISLCSVSCADNRLHLLKLPSMEVVKSISGIKTPHQYQVGYDVLDGLCCCYASGLLVLGAENYCVQVFSLYDNKELSQVQVCEKNYHPAEGTSIVISVVALSVDCCLMATVDVKFPEDEIGDLVCLKFWECGSQAGRYVLSTIIYEPHSGANVSDLAFHPLQNMAVSTSHGGDFKLWACRTESLKNAPTQKLEWRCQSIGSYKKYPMSSAVFSADGSVLAIAAGTVVTLWNPDSNVLVAVLGDTFSPIRKLAFVGNSEHLITLTRGQKPQLTAWDLSNLSINWYYHLVTEDVSSMNDGSHFAILALGFEQSGGTKCRVFDGFILIFNVESTNPLAIWSVRKAKGGRIAFVQRSPSPEQDRNADKPCSAMLAYINSDHEYILFDPLKEESESCQIERVQRGSNVLEEETELFGYTSIYGKLPESHQNVQEILTTSFVPSERPWESIFNGSSHILPPLTKLCLDFFESLLEKRCSRKELSG